MNDSIDSSHKDGNEEPDRGEPFSKDLNNAEEQKHCASFESNGIGHGIHVNGGNSGSSEVRSQSTIIQYPSSEQQGPDPLSCNANSGLTQENDCIAGSNVVLEEDKKIEDGQKTKRLKMTNLSQPGTNSFEMTVSEFGPCSPGLHLGSEGNFLDQPVDLESVTPSCSQSLSEKRVDSEDKILVEVDKNTLLEEVSESCLDHQNTFFNNDDKGNKAEICDDMLVNVASSEKEDEELPRVSSSDGGDCPLHNEEQNVTSNADCFLKLRECPKNIAPRVVNKTLDMAVSKAFVGSAKRKLLVLDVNGLLVDISSYVPYDYDPDDIIHRKAVFKRPYCDDFLNFCFERFSVGLWTSRTKRNMDPILDFLLGIDKQKLLFSWDQSHCTDTGFYTVEKRHKPLLLKKLKKLWDKCDPDLPWERGVYNETNTLLLDDTPYKALTNPQYTAIFPYSYRFTDITDNSLGPGGDLRVYLEGLAAVENVQEYVKQNPFGQRPVTERNLSWGYYLKVIEANSSPPREIDEDG